jgi:hypothetical protein
VKVDKFIRNREYHLIKGKAGKIDLFLAGGETGKVLLDFVRTPRQRVRSGSFDLASLARMGVSARGVRLAAKPVSKVKLVRAKPTRAKAARGGGSRGDSGNGGARQTSLF